MTRYRSDPCGDPGETDEQRRRARLFFACAHALKPVRLRRDLTNSSISETIIILALRGRTDISL